MAVNISSILSNLEPYLFILELIAVLVISFIIFRLISLYIKRHLLKKIKTKKQVSNVATFIDLLNFIFAIFLIIIAFSAYYGSLGELGFIAGLLTVAIGWALQKPISGVVAWLILVTRKPFTIGDRIIIDNVKGDVTNITLTHIF
jgi:small-conductance mechanosensitive channel